MKGINKRDTQYTVELVQYWHLGAWTPIVKEDAEKYGYIPFRLTLEPKGKEGYIQTGFHILGRDKEELKESNSIVLQMKTYTGVYKDLVLNGRE